MSNVWEFFIQDFWQYIKRTTIEYFTNPENIAFIVFAIIATVAAVAGAYYLGTHEEKAEVVERFLNEQEQKIGERLEKIKQYFEEKKKDGGY